MDDLRLYEQILGLDEPWLVEAVDLDLAGGKVTIDVAHRDRPQLACRRCGKPSPLYNHAAARTWRHLDTCQLQTRLTLDPSVTPYARLWAEDAIHRIHQRLIDNAHKLHYFPTGQKRLTHALKMDPDEARRDREYLVALRQRRTSTHPVKLACLRMAGQSRRTRKRGG